MMLRHLLIIPTLALAAPVAAQSTAPEPLRSGLDIQVRRSGDTTWTAAWTGNISRGEQTCLVARLAPVDPVTGDVIMTSFKAFTGVRLRDVEGRWHEISAAALLDLQQCALE